MQTLVSSTTVDDPRVCRREQLEQTLAAALHRLGWSLRTPQWTAQQLLIYAPGGGLGHLMRAVNMARLLGPATIIHTSRWLGSVCPPDVNLVAVPAGQRTASALGALLGRLMGDARMLIVDTFPGGLAGELTDAILERVGCRVMVQRYLKTEAYPDYHTLIQRYTHILRPYPNDACEWDGDGLGQAVGYMVRPLSIDTTHTPCRPWTLLGAAHNLPRHWWSVVGQGRWIRGAFELLPDAPVVAVGAGYNTTYELLTLGLPFALVPLEKRFDDPWRRAGLLGRALHTRGQLDTFLEIHGHACHP